MNPTVLITGCSSGLGRSTAIRFADAGWNVVATTRTPMPTLPELDHARVLVRRLDVTDQQSVQNAVDAAIDVFGTIDVLVNNAGISFVSVLEAMPEELMQRLWQTNVVGPVRLMQAVLPHFRARRSGTIVNISSGVGLVAVPLLSLYVASKHAIEGLSESLAYELESLNIRVRLVEPGAIRTTSFGANALAFSEQPRIPEDYDAYYRHAMGVMMDYPFPETLEADVVETIFHAATDPSTTLRYPIGPDVDEYARLRWSTSESDYMAGMRRLVGQDRWPSTHGDA